MLSLQQIQHDKFYIDCGDNTTLRECVKLLPYNAHWTQMLSLYDKGIAPSNTVISVVENREFFTVSKELVLDKIPKYKHTDISEFAHLHSNWYDTVHIMD